MPLLGFLAASSLNRFLLSLLPARIRIVFLHCFGQTLGFLPEILLIHHSVLAHHEGHHSRRPVFRRIGYKREPRSHFAVCEITLGCARRFFSLPRQYVVIVAAIRSRSVIPALGVALSNRRRYQRSNRAWGFAAHSLPIKAVVLPVITEDFLRVLVVLSRVFFLRRHQLLTNLDRRHFIPAHSPVQNLSLTRFRVEIPRTAFVHQRYGRRPILGADIQNRDPRLVHQPMH